MIDFTKLSVAEIRQKIQEDFGLDQQEVENVKGKAQLVNLYQSLANASTYNDTQPEDDIMPTLDEVIEDSTDDLAFDIIHNEDSVAVDGKISRSSPEWSTHVLNKLRPDEKDSDKNGNTIPKTDGLKRLVEELIGAIIDIDNEPVQIPCPENGYIATVRSRVAVQLYESDVDVITYTGIADCKKSDCPSPFDKFVSAIAETRAEGRAYRKILALKNVVTSEEIIGADKVDEDLTDTVTKAQKTYLLTMCKNADRGLNLNIEQLFHKITGKQYNKLRRYSQQDAFNVISVINLVQNDESKRPEGVNGYDATWLENFGSDS